MPVMNNGFAQIPNGNKKTALGLAAFILVISGAAGFIRYLDDENNKFLLSDSAVLGKATKESLAKIHSRQIIELESIFGVSIDHSVSANLFLKNIEPKKLIFNLIKLRLRREINQQVLPDWLTPIYDKINSSSKEDLMYLYDRVKKIKSFSHELKDPDQLRDWRKFKHERKKKVNKFQTNLIEREKVRRMVLNARAKRFGEKRFERPGTGRSASLERTRFRPQHRI